MDSGNAHLFLLQSLSSYSALYNTPAVTSNRRGRAIWMVCGTLQPKSTAIPNVKGRLKSAANTWNASSGFGPCTLMVKPHPPNSRFILSRGHSTIVGNTPGSASRKMDHPQPGKYALITPQHHIVLSPSRSRIEIG